MSKERFETLPAILCHSELEIGNVILNLFQDLDDIAYFGILNLIQDAETSSA